MNRRDLLKLSALLPAALAWQRPAFAAIDAPGLKEGETFSRDALTAYARALAKKPYQAPDSSLPSPFQDLDYNHYVAIRFRPERAIWSTEARGFVIEPLHRGFIYAAPVDLFTVEDGRVLIVPYDPSLFDFGSLGAPPPDAKLGFSGFRLKAPFDVPDRFDDFAIFQGATYFRAIAKAQSYGAVARGLAINTGEASGEEFPFFRAFWIERPQPGANALVVHALLDSEAASGAYRFTLKPGDMTFIDVDATIFPRTKIEHVGIAALNSMYFFGANDRKGVDDVRLAVHQSSGLQMWNGGGEWIWRPLQNPETLQISAFVDQNPRGFGLLQRNRDVAAFQDEGHRYERQPSVWVQPLGDWGEGSVQLVEIPSDSEIHDNIIAYWRPKDPLEQGREYSFSYRTIWCWAPPDQPQEAVAHQTRTGANGGRNRRFVIDFEGDIFSDQERMKAIAPMVAANPGKVKDITFSTDAPRRLGRLSFVLDPENETFSEMRAVLKDGDKPVSETWLYRWTP
jgi:periplasmic glucans biosynthesis protein